MVRLTVRAGLRLAAPGILALAFLVACQSHWEEPSTPTATIIITGAQQATWTFDGESNDIRCSTETGSLVIWLSNVRNGSENAVRFIEIGNGGVPTDDQWPPHIDPADGIYDITEVWVGGGYHYGTATYTIDGEELTTSCTIYSEAIPSAPHSDWREITARCYDAFAWQSSLDYQFGNPPRIDLEAHVLCRVEAP